MKLSMLWFNVQMVGLGVLVFFFGVGGSEPSPS